MIPLIDILSYVNRPLVHWLHIHLATQNFFMVHYALLHTSTRKLLQLQRGCAIQLTVHYQTTNTTSGNFTAMHLLLHPLSIPHPAVSAMSYAMHVGRIWPKRTLTEISPVYSLSFRPALRLSSRWRKASARRRASAAGLWLIFPLARAPCHPRGRDLLYRSVRLGNQRQQAVGAS